jgi:hypothetical protein
MWILYLVMFVITVIISYLWVRGIDKMTEYQKENPDYKGQEFLNFEELDEKENNDNK